MRRGRSSGSPLSESLLLVRLRTSTQEELRTKIHQKGDLNDKVRRLSGGPGNPGNKFLNKQAQQTNLSQQISDRSSGSVEMLCLPAFRGIPRLLISHGVNRMHPAKQLGIPVGVRRCATLGRLGDGFTRWFIDDWPHTMLYCTRVVRY